MSSEGQKLDLQHRSDLVPRHWPTLETAMHADQARAGARCGG